MIILITIDKTVNGSKDFGKNFWTLNDIKQFINFIKQFNQKFNQAISDVIKNGSNHKTDLNTEMG